MPARETEPTTKFPRSHHAEISAVGNQGSAGLPVGPRPTSSPTVERPPRQSCGSVGSHTPNQHLSSSASATAYCANPTVRLRRPSAPSICSQPEGTCLTTHRRKLIRHLLFGRTLADLSIGQGGLHALENRRGREQHRHRMGTIGRVTFDHLAMSARSRMRMITTHRQKAV